MNYPQINVGEPCSTAVVSVAMRLQLEKIRYDVIHNHVINVGQAFILFMQKLNLLIKPCTAAMSIKPG